MSWDLNPIYMDVESMVAVDLGVEKEIFWGCRDGAVGKMHAMQPLEHV